MEFSDLKIFKTVVDEGGIIRAARALHRVQSSVSTRIRQLELSTGAELFVRGGRRLTLTPRGELLLSYADRMLRLSEEAETALANTAPSGVLRLGSLESTAASRLPAVLSAYHKAHPQVRIELTTAPNDALVTSLTERRIDAAFVAETCGSNAGLSMLPLFRERLVVISSTAHPPIRTAKHVRGDSLIAFPRGCAYRRAFERWAGRRTLATLRVLEFNSYHAIIACVAAGTGIALVPESVLEIADRRFIAAHRVSRVHEEIVTPILWRKQEVSAALLALLELLKTIGDVHRRASPIRSAAASGRNAYARVDG